MKSPFFLILFTALQFALFPENAVIIKKGMTIAARYPVPSGYTRIVYDNDSSNFALFLRDLPLKKYGEHVRYYDGSRKNNDVYDSVIDMPILKKNLIQCADAIIKIRAEFLYSQKMYAQIGFHITNGMFVPFEKFAQGYRVKVSGNKTSWIKKGMTGYDRKLFDEYLEFIYTYAGTLSLLNDLKSVDLDKIQAGDVIVKGGSPGHALLIADVCVNIKTGDRIILLVQSYMPSQEMQVLKSFDALNPWYKVKSGEFITPEWTFSCICPMRFK
jgi:hypothetical protein